MKRRPEGLSAALDLIPAEGEVSQRDYDRYVARFLQSFADAESDRVGALPSASRLLAMKRPDVFVCVSNGNKPLLCENFGVLRSTLQLDTYWQTIVEPMMQTDWWNVPPPTEQVERAVWEGRAALLDVLYWQPTANQIAELGFIE